MTVQAVRRTLLYEPLVPAALTATPVLFEPPAGLTDGRHEVWAAVGGPTGWGGCQIWGSVDNATYDYMGSIDRAAIVGVLAAPLPLADDPDTVNVMDVSVAATHGTIHPASDLHADMMLSLCWVGGELIAHTAAQLIGAYQYRLDRRLRRGMLGTNAASHPIGTQFARLNGAIHIMRYPHHWVGSTVFLKFPAHNEFGMMHHSLDRVSSYSVQLTGASGK